MKQIQLDKGKVALVDDEDYEYLNKYNWFAHKNKYGRYYACRDEHVGELKKRIYMARQIMGCEHGDKKIVDHINC